MSRVEQWVAERVAQDPQMRSAAAARSLHVGESRGPDGAHELLAVLTRQHDHLTALGKRLGAIPAYGASDEQVQQRAAIIDLIRDVASRHESAERRYLWPAVRTHLADGDARADAALAQEQQSNDTLAALATAAPDSDEHGRLAEQLISQLRAHVAYEDKVFLDLRDATDEQIRSELGEQFLQAYEHKEPA